MFKFLHTADIHLDSPLLNLNKYDDAPREEFRRATRRAFDNIVDLAIREEVHFVLIAGDLYDGDCSDFHTPLHFRRQMGRLRDHGIRVFIIQGNHDAANNMRKAFRLQLPDNVHLFSTNKPETVRIDELDVAIHGQGFAQREVVEDLSKSYPEAISGCVNVGMLHTSCGAHEQHGTYAPSTIKGLSSKHYDYWALGHIHKYQTMAGPHPWIVYSGNPQGRSVKETGPRGCVIATYDGHRIITRRHEVDVMRWARLEIGGERCSSADAVLPVVEQRIADELAKTADRPVAARIELMGATEAHDDLIRQVDYWDQQIRVHVLDRFDEQVWVEKIKFKTRPRVDRWADDDSALGDLISQLKRPNLAQNAYGELQADFEKMSTTVPSDPRIARDEIDLDQSETRETILSGAQALLIARLMEGGDDV